MFFWKWPATRTPSSSALTFSAPAEGSACWAFLRVRSKSTSRKDIIFKGATVLGINGRKMFETWYQMTALLKAGKLDLHPVITNRLPITDFTKGMELLNSGKASKILLFTDGNDPA